jgi:uncharacterized repeat protein (TIGR01451 family)
MHLCMRRTTLSLSLCALLAVLGPAAAHAQPAFLVKDVTIPALTPSPFPYRMTVANGLVFFPLDDGIYGNELWRSDGTEAGTFLLADICPGVCASDPVFLTPFGGDLYFSVGRYPFGYALWKTDGTKAGTVKVLDLYVSDMAPVNGKLILSAYSSSSQDAGVELWTSDGTTAGTVLMADIWPGTEDSWPSFLGQAGSNLYFNAEDPTHGRELWKTDGTPAGTSLVKDLGPGDSFFRGSPVPPETFVAVGNRLFFKATPPFTAGTFWVTDGTEAGTYSINDLVPDGSSWGTEPLSMTVRGGDVFFVVGSRAGNYIVWELWKTDGTAAGTLRLKSDNLAMPHSRLPDMGVLGNTVFFAGIDAAGVEPWTTDGTPAGTARFADLFPGPGYSLNPVSMNPFTTVGADLLFFADDGVHGMELWKTDGSPGGTSLVADLNPGAADSFGNSDSFDHGTVTDGRWFFGAHDAAGWALWVSDGTPAGTQLVRRFPVHKTTITGFAPLGSSQVVFGTTDGVREGLWTSDGTGPGTIQVPKTISGFRTPVRLGDLVVFQSTFGALWRTDGTADGTWQVPGTPSGYYPMLLVPAGNQVFFDRQFNGGLWVTDGTGVSQIANGLMDDLSLTAFGDHALFTSTWEATLRISDGTPAGTVVVPGATESNGFGAIAAAGDRFFFVAKNGYPEAELWVKEAASPLPSRVSPAYPDPAAFKSIGPVRQVSDLSRNVLLAADDGVIGEELWTSDGTAAGLKLVADIRPGPASSGIADLTRGRDKTFFTADDGVHGRELWVTDGTAAGTHLVRDILPGPGSANPQQLRVIGHVLLFSAQDETHGFELWRSDGTEAGTYLLQDIAPGPDPSSPQAITAAGPYVYFTANDGVNGFQPWAIPRAALGSALAATKTVTGQGSEGGTVTYTIVIVNVGAGPSADNPGDEMVDVLPAGLTLLDASADTGTATVDLPGNRVTWNGALPIGGTATVTIHARVGSSIFPGVILNQATLAYDGDGNGTNESAAVSGGPGAGAPTPLNVSLAAVDFFTAAPCRIVDTRTSSPLASGVVRTFTVAGTCGIPAGAKAVAANVTVVSPSGAGYVSVYPSGTAAGTATVNFTAGLVRAGNAVLALKNGALDAKALVGGNGTVQVVIDVSGYFQ